MSKSTAWTFRHIGRLRSLPISPRGLGRSGAIHSASLFGGVEEGSNIPVFRG